MFDFILALHSLWKPESIFLNFLLLDRKYRSTGVEQEFSKPQKNVFKYVYGDKVQRIPTFVWNKVCDRFKTFSMKEIISGKYY